jgi:Purple acid Phosphatase, N-terminal domain
VAGVTTGDAAHVEIIGGSELEFAREDLAIVRWTTNNPGGSDNHFGVVHYGTNPKDLSQIAKSQVRLNRGHPDTLFRVRMDGLSPRTTYYYTVTSMESNGTSDGVKSAVNHFTTPGPGQRTEAYPQPVPQPK